MIYWIIFIALIIFLLLDLIFWGKISIFIDISILIIYIKIIIFFSYIIFHKIILISIIIILIHYKYNSFIIYYLLKHILISFCLFIYYKNIIQLLNHILLDIYYKIYPALFATVGTIEIILIKILNIKIILWIFFWRIHLFLQKLKNRYINTFISI